VLVPDRNVSLLVVVVVRWECVKSRLHVISKVCGKRGTVSSFYAFHQTVISTAGVAITFS